MKAVRTLNFPQAVSQVLVAEGTTDLFGLMGSGNMRVIYCMEHDFGARYHAARHEAGSIAAADGYARATGRVGVCTVTQGPGLTNALTPLITARKANTPMVLLTGDSSEINKPGDPFARVQSVSWKAFFETADVPAIRPTPETVVADVRTAFARARRESRPIAIVMPYEFDVAEVIWQDLPPAEEPAPAVPDPTAIDAAARKLRAAARPLLLAGRGAVRAGAGDALRALADELGAVVGTSLPGSGYFRGHPGDLGLVGGFARPSVQAAVNACDCVLAIGVGLNGFTTDKRSLMSDADVIHVDRDAAAFGRHRPVGSTLVGEARLVAEALLERVRALGGAPSSARTEPVIAKALARPRSDPFEDESQKGDLDPRALIRRLDELLPLNRAGVSDGGRFSSFVVRRMFPESPDALLYMQEFGSVGGGLGAAIGAAVGRPERLTVLFLGDSGLLMTLGDLDTAIRERIPLLVVCMNNQALGSEITLLNNAGLDIRDAYMDTPDFSLVAKAMGADGLLIETLDQLDVLPERIKALSGPLVLDCRVTRRATAI